MKFALVDSNKIEATKGAKGICPGCGSEVIAKCGDVKLHHWAHKGNRDCDPWWENETEWHRTWKNKFPKECQESILHDEQTSEKHIADVRTSHGLVIEFQHSHIDPQERRTRENFYKKMFWVVDGTRLKGDFPRFVKGRKYLNKTKQGFFLVDYPEICFPSTWLGSSVPVIFDFRGTESTDDLNDLKNNLYCLLPKKNNGESKVLEISRESFIKYTINGEWVKRQQVPQNQNANPPTKSNIVIKRTEPSHYLNPRTGRFVKRRRF